MNMDPERDRGMTHLVEEEDDARLDQQFIRANLPPECDRVLLLNQSEKLEKSSIGEEAHHSVDFRIFLQ
jgi:hypothetical protein